MSEEYYQSAYTGSQIDDAIGRITNGEIDRLAENAAASAQDAELSAEDARSSALDASIHASDAINAANSAMGNSESARGAAQSSAASAFAAQNSETNAKLSEENANRSQEMADDAATLAAQKAMEAAEYASDVPPPIVERETGEAIYVSDSAERPLKGLRLFGKTTQDGTPTPEAPVELVSTGDGGSISTTLIGKNLLNLSSAQIKNGLYNNETLIANQNGEYYIEIENFTELAWNSYIGKTFTLSFESVGSNRQATVVIEHTKNGAISYSEFFGQNTITFALSDTKGRIGNVFFRFNRSPEPITDTTTIIKNIQFELGDTATAYEPYVSGSSITVQTPNGLPGIPVTSGGNYTDENGRQWICDEVDFTRGVLVKRTHTVVLDGAETCNLEQRYDAGRFQIIKASMPTSLNYRLGLCSHFVFSGAPVVANDVDMAISVFETNLYLRYDAITSVDDLKAFMANQAANGTPCTVKYLLAEPIETPLSAEELAAYAALHTNYPNTTVLNDGGAGMELAYVADTKIYIDNKFAELAAAIVNNT